MTSACALALLFLATDAQTVDAVADRALNRHSIPGLSVAVMRRGRIVVAKGYGLADRESGAVASERTVYQIGSISKQFTAAGVMRLVERGRVALDDRVSLHLPAYRPQGDAVLVRHLLHQTSGIRELFTIPRYEEGIADPRRPTSELIEIIEKEPLGFTPGDHWSYSNSNYTLLATIIEKATGKPYERLLEEEFFRPLKLTETQACAPLPTAAHHARGYRTGPAGVVPVEPENMNWIRGDGGLCSNVEDLARWMHALAAGRAVSAASYRIMTSTGSLGDGTRPDYGYALSLVPLDGRHRKVSHGGAMPGFSATLAYYPAADLIIAVLANLAGVWPQSIEQQIARGLLGLPPPTVLELPVGASERKLYVGAYDIGVFTVRISERDGGLWMEMPRPGPTSALLYQGQGAFLADAEPDAIRLAFRTERGQKPRLVLQMAGMHWYGRRID